MLDVSGEILCRYSINSEHLFALSCARVLLVYLCSVCSCAFIFGGMSFITLLFVLACTLYYCFVMRFMFFTVCNVVVIGVVSLIVV